MSKIMMRLITLLPALLAACATTGSPRREIVFDPIEIRVDPADPILKMNDEELFAGGVAAYAAGDFARAAQHFQRLADFFPASAHLRSALYNLGLALAKSGDYRSAGERFRQVMQGFPGHQDALDATFRLAECHYQLDELADAERILTELLQGELTDSKRAEAKVKLGVVQFESGQVEAAETTLRDALKQYRAMEDNETPDEYYTSQAQFFLGEAFRTYYSRMHLDPSATTDEAALAEELEHKCELLLSAQGHYLRTIRMGDAEWATAAGFRIGSLYEELFDELTEAPAPPDLDEDQVQLYRRELQKKVKVLITKAIGIYERTLAAAERTQATNAFVEQTQKSLDRMKSLLSVEEEREAQDRQEEDGDSEGPPGSEAPMGEGSG